MDANGTTQECEIQLEEQQQRVTIVHLNRIVLVGGTKREGVESGGWVLNW